MAPPRKRSMKLTTTAALDGPPADGAAPTLAQLLSTFESGAPAPADVAWVSGLRARLAHDPADREALTALTSPRFLTLCETLHISPEVGRERLFASLSTPASPPPPGADGPSSPPPADAPRGGAGYRKVVRLLVAVAVVAAIAVALYLLPVRESLLSFLSWSRGVGVWGPVSLAALYVVACVLFLPGSILTLGAGFAFGLLPGLAAVMAGSVAGAAAAFLLGRTVARGWVGARLARSPRFAAIDRAVGEHGFKIVLLLRLSPLFPFNLLNYALGVTRVSFRDYLLASWIGMAPATVMYVYLGTAAGSLAEIAAGGGGTGGGSRLAMLLLGLAATVAVTVVITRIARRALAEVVEG